MKFSIIVPVYNVEDYLTECIESIIAQTFHDYEVCGNLECLKVEYEDGKSYLNEALKRFTLYPWIYAYNKNFGVSMLLNI